METQKNNRPNQVFDDGKVFVEELKTYQDAENLPIKKVWRVCKAQSSFEKYKRNGCRLFFVDNREGNDMCYTLMIAYPDGKLDFLDMEDIKIEDNHIDEYLETFTEEAKSFLLTISQNMKNESFCNPKHVLRFDEYALLEKYEVYGYGVEFKTKTGNTIKSVVSLKDEYGGKTHIAIDDGCYILYNGDDEKGFVISSWIYPEAHAALKELPNLPVY